VPDTALIGQLMRFEQRHSLQMTIVSIIATATAVPSPATALSTGNVSTPIDSSTNAYSPLEPAGIWVTAGMAATDSATGPRGTLLKYLSARSRNRGVDKLIEGCKYFLSESGRPFAHMGPKESLDSRVADYIVQANVPDPSVPNHQ
jgi:hypothetical protein